MWAAALARDVRGTLVALLLLLLTPGALAASQVHVTLAEGGYAVTFASGSTAESIPVRHAGGEARATRVDEEGGDTDRIYRALLPFDAREYEVEGRRFPLPAPPGEREETRIVFVADIGTNANASRVLEAIRREEPDLVLAGGDLSYANGESAPWNEWFELVEPLAASVPLMPAYGNHEDYCQRGGKLESCGPASNEWHAHFALPNGDALFYAFDWGPVRVSVLDTEAYVHEEGAHVTRRDEQESFLRRALDEDATRWDLVMFHRPMRSTMDRDGATAGPSAPGRLDALLDQADLVLAAHVHAYERSWPLRSGAPIAQASEAREGEGTFHVTSGGGGRPLYDTWREEEPWLAKRASEFHFVVLDVTATRIEARALRPDGSELDAFTITRPEPPTPTLTPPSPTPAGTTPTSTTSPAATSPTSAAEENATPAPSLLVAALVAVMLSARRSRPRAPG